MFTTSVYIEVRSKVWESAVVVRLNCCYSICPTRQRSDKLIMKLLEAWQTCFWWYIWGPQFNVHGWLHGRLFHFFSVGGISISPSFELHNDQFIISHLFCRTSCCCVLVWAHTHWHTLSQTVMAVLRLFVSKMGCSFLFVPAVHSLHHPISLPNIAALAFIIVLFCHLFTVDTLFLLLGLHRKTLMSFWAHPRSYTHLPELHTPYVRWDAVQTEQCLQTVVITH